MSSQELLLDPSLRYWVLLPISFVMVLVGILRTHITVLLQPSPKITEWGTVKEQQHLQQSRNFRMNSAVLLSKDDFRQRQKYLSESLKTGKFLKDTEDAKKKEQPKNPLTDPGAMDAMMGMAKGNMANFIPQTVIMWWVNYFFAGFVIMKLPFPLTVRFKSMLQNSVQTPDLDVRWVSSISWYFVNLLGLKSVYSLILQDNTLVDKMMAAQNQQGQPNLAMPGGPTMDKLMKGEAENVMIAEFKSCLDDTEKRLLQRFA